MAADPRKAAMDGWAEVFLAHACAHGQLRLPALLRCGRVRRCWREAVLASLPTLRALDFRGFAARVSGPDVLAALARVAGANLAAVDLAGCQRLSAADVEQIMARVAARCPGAAQIDVEGCSEAAQLCALALRARAFFDAASPRALFEFIAALPMGGATRCPLEHLLALLSTGQRPSLVLDLVPGQNALRDAARPHGSAWVAAVLLSVSFPTGEKRAPRTFQKEQEISGSRRRAVHAAAERGDEALLEVLISAGAALDVKDCKDDTPLLLACRAGHLELAKMLVGAGAVVWYRSLQHDTPLLLTCRAGDLEFAKVLLDKGADVSAANKQGDTPLLAAVAAGNAQLARELAAQGASPEASRKDGANVLVLAIISKNEACIRFAITQGLKQLEGQDTLEVCALIQSWARAFLNPAWMGARIRDGAAPSALMAEIGALLSWADVCAHLKDQLEDVLAFLSHHKALLGDCSRWPMPQAEQVVEQLASQEPGTIFAPGESGALDAGRQMAVIKRNNKPRARRRCRQTHEALRTITTTRTTTVHAVAVSPDGSRLAYAAEKTVVVRDFQTGLVMLQMEGHTR